MSCAPENRGGSRGGGACPQGAAARFLLSPACAGYSGRGLDWQLRGHEERLAPPKLSGSAWVGLTGHCRAVRATRLRRVEM
jgi:hypothetical protein